MAIRKFTVPVTTASGGGATAYSPWLTGYIESVEYVKDDFADTVDFTITADETGESILALTNRTTSGVFRPRAATCGTDGAAALYADTGTAVNDRIALGRDRIKVVIAEGGDTKSGAFIISVDDAR